MDAIHFRFRVLDLLDVFVKHESANPLVFALILPLLDCITPRSTAFFRNIHTNLCSGDKLVISFMNKVKATFMKICHSKEYPKGAEVDVDGLHMILDELFHRAMSPSLSPEGEGMVKEAVIFLIKVLLGQGTRKGTEVLLLDPIEQHILS